MPNNSGQRKRIIGLQVLPGQPTNSTGRLCIHLFVRDTNGSFTENSVLHVDTNVGNSTSKRKLIAKPTKGRIACQRTLTPKNTKNGSMLLRSDDPRAVTCPRCVKSPDFQMLMTLIQSVEN